MSMSGNGWLCIYQYQNGIHDLSHAQFFDGFGEAAAPAQNITFAEFSQLCNTWGGVDAIRIVDATLANSGNGTAASSPTAFDPSTLDPLIVVEAFTSGAFIVFPAFAIAWGAAFVVNYIKGRS